VAEELTLADLRPDPANARRHTAKNIGVIADSLQAVGAARSIVVDEHNRVLAGNGVTEAAAQVGITKVLVVDADGNTVVAVRRKNLSDAQKTALAISDNRANELSYFDDEVLAQQLNDLRGVDDMLAAAGFTKTELEQLLKKIAEPSAPASFTSVDEDVDTKHTCPRCGYRWS